MSPNCANFYFADDNLKDLYDNHKYVNSNLEWYKFYNATLVVPISMIVSTDERSVLGFITIDNQAGNLATKINTEFLCGVGDLLYNLFDIYGELITVATLKKIKNDKIDRFSTWYNTPLN